MLRLPAGREASTGVGAPPYVRHCLERTLLYRLVEECFPAFKAHLAAQGTALPGYVEQEFEEHLKCGRLEQGCMRHIPVPHPTGDLQSSQSAVLSIGETWKNG
jgi:hypothetical protein